MYTSLASQAQERWRSDDALNKHYHECGLAVVGSKGQNGWEYIEKSKHNVAAAHEEDSQKTERPDGEPHEDVQVLENEEAIREILDTDGGSSGEAGYVNWRSGWADAGGAMRETRARVSALARTQARTLWKRGQASRLLFGALPSSSPPSSSSSPSPQRAVTGVQLTDGTALHADLTILATGAWTGSLLDLRGRVEASGQVVAYVPLSPSEAQRLRNMPVILNFATGMFAIPPSHPPPPSSPLIAPPDPHLKIARHAYGYRNPTTIQDPSQDDGNSSRTVSLPASTFSAIPPEGESACRTFLASLVPWLADRPFSATRLCWYADTPEGNFVVDYHPGVRGLFLATGGSGHAFKFLPVLGARVLEAVEGRLEEAGLGACWGWKGVVEGFVGTEDGSRGEVRGVLGVEMGRGRDGRGERVRRDGGSKL